MLLHRVEASKPYETAINLKSNDFNNYDGDLENREIISHLNSENYQ